MKPFLTVGIFGLCAFAMSGCGETTSNSNKTVTVKKETRTDSDGNEKTKVETKTEETTVRKDDAPINKTQSTTTTTIEVKKDPMIKIGPLEIKN